MKSVIGGDSVFALVPFSIAGVAFNHGDYFDALADLYRILDNKSD